MTVGLDITLPPAWTWSLLKFSTSFINRGTAPNYVEEGPVRVVSQAANQLFGIDWERTRLHDYQGDPRRLKGFLLFGDVLINSTGTGTLGRVGYFAGGIDGLPCMADSHVTVARADRSIVEPRYLYYWLSSTLFYEYIYSALTVGATNQIELNRERLAGAPVALPPLDEQRRIADFLDHETFHIDKSIGLRRRQAAVIDELGSVRAFDAIRGVDVPEEKCDSGLPWLGSVPQSWRIAAVAHLFEVELGKMLNQERAEGDHLRPYLRVANVQWGTVDTSDLLEMDFPPEDRKRFRLRAGDLLVCEGGSWPGRSAIWNGEIDEIYYQKAIHRIRSMGPDLVQWLYYCLLVAERMKVFLVQGNSSTMTHLTREQLRPQRFPFPDIETQQRVVDQLDSATVHDAQARSTLSRQLALIVERRQALITAAVTGQIDVTTARGFSKYEGVAV